MAKYEYKTYGISRWWVKVGTDYRKATPSEKARLDEAAKKMLKRSLREV